MKTEQEIKEELERWEMLDREYGSIEESVEWWAVKILKWVLDKDE